MGNRLLVGDGGYIAVGFSGRNIVFIVSVCARASDEWTGIKSAIACYRSLNLIPLKR